MDLKQFTKDAIRTESTIDQVVTNEILLTSTIQSLISMGNVLDQVKKHVFYGEPYDHSALSHHLNVSWEASKTLSTLTVDEVNNNEQGFNINPRIFHGIVGMSTEATELLEALDLYDNKSDEVNLSEEIGDSIWYGSIILDEIGVGWKKVMTTVIAKLKARYPNKFTVEDSINRDLDAERTILEDGTK
jgi:hypothetical protein